MDRTRLRRLGIPTRAGARESMHQGLVLRELHGSTGIDDLSLSSTYAGSAIERLSAAFCSTSNTAVVRATSM
jgi:hypothetical protein